MKHEREALELAKAAGYRPKRLIKPEKDKYFWAAFFHAIGLKDQREQDTIKQDLLTN